MSDQALEREVMAIGGQAGRRSFDRKYGRLPLHLASAFATEQGLLLAQCAVANKGDEQAVMPELLYGLDLRAAW